MRGERSCDKCCRRKKRNEIIKSEVDGEMGEGGEAGRNEDRKRKDKSGNVEQVRT